MAPQPQLSPAFYALSPCAAGARFSYIRKMLPHGFKTFKKTCRPAARPGAATRKKELPHIRGTAL